MSKKQHSLAEQYRKELAKSLRKFNRSQSELIAFGRHYNDLDKVIILRVSGFNDVKVVLSIDSEDIDVRNNFSFNATLLREIEKWHLLLSKLNKAKKPTIDPVAIRKIPTIDPTKDWTEQQDWNVPKPTVRI